MIDDYGEPVEVCGAPDYEKDPDSTEDFTFNLAGALNDDTILSGEFLLPDGLTKVSESNTASDATIMVRGGSRGRTYRITYRYTTAAGRTFDQTIRILVREQ